MDVALEVYLPDMARVWLAEKNISASSTKRKNSAMAREDDLCRFARALGTVGHLFVAEGVFNLDEDLGELPLRLFDRQMVVRAVDSLLQTYKKSTVARTVSTARQFTRWLFKQGHLQADPFEDVQVKAPPGVLRPSGKYFTDEELDAIRSAALQPSRRAWSAWPARDLAVVEILAGCGIRAQELASLQVSAFDRSGEHTMLRIVDGAKGDKTRDVPVPRRAVTAVDEYLRERRERAVTQPQWEATEKSPLFVVDRRTGGGGVYTTDRMWLYRLVERLTEAGGVVMKADAAVHAFRHYYGVSLARRRVSPFLIAQLMGHADPRTTAGYVLFSGALATEGLEDAGWL